MLRCSVNELSVGTTNKQEVGDVDDDSSEEDACVLVKVIPAPVRRTRRGKRKLDITTSAEAGQEKNQDTKMLLCQPVTPECGIPKKKCTIKPDLDGDKTKATITKLPRSGSLFQLSQVFNVHGYEPKTGVQITIVPTAVTAGRDSRVVYRRPSFGRIVAIVGKSVIRMSLNTL